MKICAVVDTNVLLAALLSKKSDTATVKTMQAMINGLFTPLWHENILREYEEVFHREKFHLAKSDIEKVMNAIEIYGKRTVPALVTETFIDPDDAIFYAVAMSERDNNALLITGNKKHFPQRNFVLSPAEVTKFLGL